MNTVVLDYIFPYSCSGCGLEDQLICPKCFKKIIEKPFHRRVLKNKYLKEILVAGYYKNYAMKNTLIKCKYEGIKKYSEVIAQIMWQKLPKDFADGSFFVPVPLHFFKKNWRGFNQSEEIARHLSARYCNCVVLDALRKTKINFSQASQHHLKEREENIKDNFRLKNSVKERDIILIDDVVTTGSTLAQAAQSLVRDKPSSIRAITFIER